MTHSSSTAAAAFFQLTCLNCGAAVDDLFYCSIAYCSAAVDDLFYCGIVDSGTAEVEEGAAAF